LLKTSSSRWVVRLFAPLALLFLAAPVTAQDTTAMPPFSRAVATWISLIAAPGYERIATDRIMGTQLGWSRDSMGNLIKTAGEPGARPRRVVA